MRVTPARVVQLVVSCVVLGVGVALLLRAALGSDGYSTLINGLALSLDVPFVWVNLVVGVVLVAMAWARGLAPGLGTVVQPVVVGATVSVLLDAIAAPSAVGTRIGIGVAGFAILAVGVAGYLGTRAGAGPTEAAALAFDPPVPFRWSYTAVQAIGTFVGWLLGAAVGPATLVVIVLLGPLVDLVARLVPAIGTPAERRVTNPGIE
ncbi:MAG: hypothetical protein ACTHMS_11485 [Jatrophihabitans sp.]|uniref:hypothetical protein n=1 Tax=Jatrophihabitans sp. TaxID=1932789 RepID=UPI003F7D5ABE